MKQTLHKKTQKSTQHQTKLSTYYQSNTKKPMKQPQQDGWTVAERVELRHARNNNPQPKQVHSSQPANNHSATDQLSSVSANSHTYERPNENKQPSKKVNVEFYLNRMPSQPYGQYIDKIHEIWYHNYEKLERDHSFIQWIFPNSFQSRFNSHAKPLSKEEAEEFRSNPEIIKRYLKSYDMMLAFYGIKIKDKHTGELIRSRQPNYKERFYKTLITSWHNHMRVTRILCSLKQTGFGRYAAQLCKFLKFQIFHKNGELGALKRFNIYREWEPFEHYQEKGEPINYYLQKINKKTENNRPIEQKSETINVIQIDESVREGRSKSLEKSPAHRVRQPGQDDKRKGIGKEQAIK